MAHPLVESLHDALLGLGVLLPGEYLEATLNLRVLVLVHSTVDVRVEVLGLISILPRRY